MQMQVIKSEIAPNGNSLRRRTSNWFLLGESSAASRRPTICLRIGENSVGKASASDIRIPSRLVSRAHCTLTASDSEVILRDRSQNGTYVNHYRYYNSRQILNDGDLVSFGSNSFKYDKDDQNIFVYRLKYENHTISLCDDDDDERIVNNSIKLEANDATISLDSTGATNNAYDTGNDTDEREAKDAIDDGCHWNQLNISGNDNDVSPCYEDEVFEKRTTQLRTSHTPLNIVSNIVLADSIPLIADIKEEVSYMTYEYERSLKHDVEPHVSDTIDLCSDNEEVYVHTNVPNEQNTMQRRSIKHASTEYQFIIKQPENDEKPRTKIVSAANAMPESEKKRLIDAVQMKPDFLKAHVHVAVNSRGKRLALDLLGLCEASASTSTERHKPSLQQSQAFLSRQREPLTPPLEDVKTYPCKWSVDSFANRLVSEMTSWDVKWLLDQNSDAPVCDEKLTASPIPTVFNSLHAYQNIWYNFAKLELWETIMYEYRQESAKRPVFPNLTDVKYAQRADNYARFIYFCEATIEENDTNSLLHVDSLVLVTHGKGKFFAIITAVKLTKEDNKRKMVFEMEAAKVATNAKMGKPKLISVKFVSDIHLRLAELDALMDVNKSPLYDTILVPLANCNSLMGQSSHVDEWTQDEIVDALQRKCIESVSSNRQAFYLIDGGPGTGKTIVCLNAIIGMITKKSFSSKRILFCASTNASVDHIAYQLLSCQGKEFVRFGNLQTIHPSLQHVSIPFSGLTKSQQHTINNTQVALTTVNLASKLVRVSVRDFDLCIIDEASLATELMLLPLLKLNFKVLVLVGDKYHRPSSMSQICREKNFTRSMFNRVIDSYGAACTAMYPSLCTQHRMHSEISYWPNKHFYARKMKPSTASMNSDANFRLQPYTVFSFQQNHNEINIVEEILSICLPYADQSEYSYGIIPASTRTKKQLEQKVRNKFVSPQIEISGFDCFRGDEKDIILITAIKDELFQLFNSPEMMNVVLTRARKALIFCGNFNEVKHLPQWNAFLVDALERKRLFIIPYNQSSNTEFIRENLVKHQ